MKPAKQQGDLPGLVLVVEDDENSADLLRTFVESQGYRTAVANSLADARQQLVLHEPAVILLDLHLPDGSGMDLFDDESLRGTADIILITGNASVETSVQALRLGAADYLIKPVSLKVLRNVFERLQEAEHSHGAATGLAGGGRGDPGLAGSGRGDPVEVEPAARRPVDLVAGTGPGGGGAAEGLGRAPAGGETVLGSERTAAAAGGGRRAVDAPLIKGRSEPIAEVLSQIEKVARTSVSVFIVGESGTGKELVAESVHRASRRRNGPFEAINCGAISAQLIESELFGHEKGSFTGAIRQHKGFFERASGGTLFLDEITEMSLDLQVKLLRVLETGTFSRVGSDTLLRSDVRIIAATNRDPFKAIGEGKLREDLYYRLNVFQILLPPLRERLEDIPDLALHFMASFGEQEGRRVPMFDDDALVAIQGYHWPGNVRELRNFLHRAAILVEHDRIRAADLPPFVSGGVGAGRRPGAISRDPGAQPRSPGEADGADLKATSPGPATGPAGSAVAMPPGPGREGQGREVQGRDSAAAPKVEVPVGTTIADMERALILATLAYCQGAKERTADLLGISLKTLYNRLRSYED